MGPWTPPPKGIGSKNLSCFSQNYCLNLFWVFWLRPHLSTPPVSKFATGLQPGSGQNRARKIYHSVIKTPKLTYRDRIDWCVTVSTLKADDWIEVIIESQVQQLYISQCTVAADRQSRPGSSVKRSQKKTHQTRNSFTMTATNKTLMLLLIVTSAVAVRGSSESSSDSASSESASSESASSESASLEVCCWLFTFVAEV